MDDNDFVMDDVLFDDVEIEHSLNEYFGFQLVTGERTFIDICNENGFTSGSDFLISI